MILQQGIRGPQGNATCRLSADDASDSGCAITVSLQANRLVGQLFLMAKPVFTLDGKSLDSSSVFLMAKPIFALDQQPPLCSGSVTTRKART
jgi:hypothetical protein